MAGTRRIPADDRPTVQPRSRSSMRGSWLPSTSMCVGHTGRRSSARRIARKVACRMLRQSISSRSAQPTAQRQRAFADPRRQALALLGRELLRIREPADRPRRIEDHRGGDHRAGQRPAPRLIDTRRRAARDASSLTLMRALTLGAVRCCEQRRRSRSRPRARRRRGAGRSCTRRNSCLQLGDRLRILRCSAAPRRARFAA